MTTIDERLFNLFKEHIDIVGDGWWHPNYGASEMKADIKKLFLDLIAEAKPANYRHEGNTSNLTANNTGLDTVSYMLDNYENNLIQAINGGKK